MEAVLCITAKIGLVEINRPCEPARWRGRSLSLLWSAPFHPCCTNLYGEGEDRKEGATKSDHRAPIIANVIAGGNVSFKPHAHMLRRACGYALANRGHDTRALQAYLRHRDIQHTVRYTELSPTRFKDFWRD
jgi:integrase